jgi:murein L,D-transpeptidase YcbB/YkuD
VIVLGLGAASPPAAASGLAAEDLRGAVAGPPIPRVEGRPVDGARLQALYARRRFAPAWEPDGRGAARADALARRLARASDHGLEPAAYHVEALRQLPLRASLARELLLTDALLRYARDLRAGRVRPADVDGDWDVPLPPFDVLAEAERALESDAFPAWLDALPPPSRGYRQLVRGLLRYRGLAALTPHTLGAGPVLALGTRGSAVAALRRRLAMEDEALPAGEPVFDLALDGAVRRFQARHGLVVDGIVGPRTREALDVPFAERARQIALNLERWRWLPRDLEGAPRYLVVNAAAADLVLVDGGHAALRSRVIVGEPARPTPVFGAALRDVVLNPPWTIPASIVRDEILPALRRNPRHLAEAGIVRLDALDEDPHGLTVDWSRAPADAPLPRLQQPPGPGNPLGRIKFDLPNRFDVYLHDTAAPALFGLPNRARSHGCVRVERALELALLLLEGHELGDRGALGRALAAGATRRVALGRPVPVHLLYWTAFVEDGAVHFRDDVYGRDRRLAAALARHDAARREPPAATPVGCPGQS